MTTYLSGREAAKRLGVSRETVRRMIAAGDLQPTAYQEQAGRRWPLFDPDYIAAKARQRTRSRSVSAVG